ncbi:DUF6543 domain-containing protein [Pseudomonas sp. Marseille-Q1929]|uniref:NEL-type E3 ubiquitin ligase domain-containing protein n=1 Tax=Pseudomonas sp. Marseille-Q1929 TaxID=2730402 RepID=UPI001A901610|nr:DUF6543 domain-containing protein [Pseudomonas sp. Marseille-Q1929]MBO0494795.1 hypothetical protein [Pseudomonas sp. Marseille-Q1929]
MPADPTTPPGLEPQTAAYELIKQKTPDWLIQASAPTRDAFKGVSTHAVDWLSTLDATQQRQMQQYNAASADSRNTLDQAMAGLQSAEAFAKPLLAEALKTQFNVEPDLDATYIDLRNPVELGALGIRVGSFSVLSLSLLQAALHNFEDSECEPGAFTSTSRFKAGPGERDASVTLGLSIPAFLKLCRTLDIGAQYQAYLKQFFQTADGLRAQVIQAQKDALQAAAYLALLKQDIGAGDYAVIQAVIADQREIRDGGKPVWFNDVSLMGLRLSGCTAFVAVEKQQAAQDVLVYIPHDPEHPLKKYPSRQALEAELTRQLMADVPSAGPGRYQQFLSYHLAYTDQPTYWRRLTQEASEQPRDAYGVFRTSRYVLPFVSTIVSIFLGPKQLPPIKPVREPIENPDFHIRVISKRELWQENVDLWGDNFDKLQAKLIADALGHAVPTAQVDAQARAKKIADLEQAGLFALNLVSMFVPGLGEVMMGVMAAQLLYETFEGVVEWHDGDREAALAHLTDVAENLAFIGVMAAGGAGVRKVLSTPPVIETLQPVTLPNGAQKLWNADLAPYKAPLQLAADAQPDVLGLYAHQGQTVVPLEGEHFALRRDPVTAEYRILHPTRPQAYAPRLAHNHEGAWQHETEHPLIWDEPTTLRRLGAVVDGVSELRLQQACEASGIEVDALRAGHIDHEPMPLALADSLQRFKAADALTDFIEQMKSADPAQYAKADPALQMNLLRRRGMLPEVAITLFDYGGEQLWSEPLSAQQPRLAVTLTEGGLGRGEFLQELLCSLQANDRALSEFPGQASDTLSERARLLRQYLAEQAEASERTLVETRYQSHNRSTNPDVLRMQNAYPSLPSPMAEHLLKNLSADQLSLFRSHGLLPPAVREQAQWQVQELRLARAYEGLTVESLASADSQRLQAHMQDSELTREAARELLLAHPLRKPAYDPSMRLLGGGRGIRQLLNTAGNALRTPSQRALRLYPRFSEADVGAFITSLGADVRGGLSRLESEYATLQQDLKTWVRANAPQANATAFDRRGGLVRTYADEIERCWRRETLNLEITPASPLELPALNADFSHVETLKLCNTPWSEAAQTFLNNFKQLKLLNIRKSGLTELPQGLGERSRLTHLRLSENRIRLTPQSVEQLAGLSRLRLLDLSENPLGLAPDLSGMPQLSYVFLNKAGLEQWPGGVGELVHLQELNLRDNRLRTIPIERLEPSPEQFESTINLNQKIALGGNPLSAEAGQALDAYWQRLSQTHPEMMRDGRGDTFAAQTLQLAQVRRMYPSYDIGQCRQYIWNLGAEAEAELARISLEFTTLKDQLDAWVFSGGGTRQRYVRMGQVLENAATRDDRSMAKVRILACWRGDTPQKLSHDGIAFGLELDLSDLRLPSLPDLEADFSHVGSLKLRGMGLRTSPEGFLSSFRGLRWLDMSNNQLRELPPAVGEMHGVTRLFLDNNQISLTAESARMLAECTTLRALWMDGNPLGRVPDFTQIPDIRSLRLKGTDIDHWPTGLGSQELLDEIDLSDNQLTTLPDEVIAPADHELVRSTRLCSITKVSSNPLSESTLQQVRVHAARLQREQLVPGNRQLQLVSSALGLRTPMVVRTVDAAFERWSRGFSPEQTGTRTAQWISLRDQPGSDGFFRVLDDLQIALTDYDDLQRRVWEVIDSITEPNPESAALRDEMFTWAGRAACCDRAALSFSNLEIMRMVYRAKAAASDASQGPALLKLARGLFRLDEVEKTALADIATRTEAINSDATLSPGERDVLIQLLEEVQTRLDYRYGLKGAEQLDLPGQPTHVMFPSLGRVTSDQLTAARTRILALDNSPEEFQALLSRDFWKDYITHKYRAQFDALSKPSHEQVAQLLERLESGELTRADCDAQAQVVQDQLAIDEAALIESLSRAEWRENPLAGPPESGTR